MKKIYLLFLSVIVASGFYAQSLTGITPSSANQGETLDVTITGENTNFTQGSGTSVHFSFEQASTTIVNSYTVIDDLNLVANITVPSNVSVGTYDVTTSNNIDGDIALTGAFSVTQASLTSITPSSAEQGETLNVSIVGENTHFLQASGTTLHFSFEQASTTIVNSYNVVDDLNLTANVTIPSDVAPGTYTVSTTGEYDGSLTLENSFTVNEYVAPLVASLTSISPDNADQGQTLDVTITGENTNFSQASTTVSFINGANEELTSTITIVDVNTLTANVTIPADATIGEYTVTVDDLTTSFTVNEYVAPLVASLTSISPDNADQGQTLDVTITGENTNFSNATIVSFTNDLSETLTSTITVVDENTLTANVVIPADATIGQYTVTVSSSDYDLTTTFSVNEVVTPEPILTSISPDNANQGETIDVTITGENTNFSNATAVSFTNDLSETLTSTITVVDVNTLTANVTIPADATIGNYTVTVDGLTTSFTVNETTASYLWSDNFSDTTKWTIANSTDDQQNWVITNISDAGVGYGTGTWEDADFVTSANNGYALFDSDIIGATGGFQDATITLNEELNFMDNDYVVLEFNNRGRMWQTTQNFVEVCNSDCDADSAEWVAYEVNAEETTSQLFENVKQVNISPTAGSQSNVKIRFRYVGSWDYAWMVDEPRIVELVPNEIVAQSAWIFEENSGGVEFGRTPISQVGNSFEIGGSVFNFGAEDQTNVTLDVNFTGPSTITASESVDLLETDSTHTYSIMSSLDLEVGLYEGVYNFSSDNDASGDNNVLKRNFEITNNVYSLDGIGIHPEEALTISSLGTASFQDASDLVCATMYSFNNNDTISSITAELGTTLANAEIIAYVIDSTNFFDGNFGEAISMSDLYVVTEDDVASGSVQIPVLGNANDGTLEYLPINPGKYYVALELFSAGNTYDIRILDDETVGQPWDYSMIYIAGAQAYSNGNAFAIRVITGNPDALGIEENFENFSMYPNPSSGTVFFNFEKNQERVLTVRDISGKVILSKVTSSNTEIDFNNYGKGIYLVNIQSENGSITEKVIIQ